MVEVWERTYTAPFDGCLMAETKRAPVPVSLPQGLVDELDRLVEAGIFASRSEALRHGARLVVLLENRLHANAERYFADEAVERQRRRRA